MDVFLESLKWRQPGGVMFQPWIVGGCSGNQRDSKHCDSLPDTGNWSRIEFAWVKSRIDAQALSMHINRDTPRKGKPVESMGRKAAGPRFLREVTYDSPKDPR